MTVKTDIDLRSSRSTIEKDKTGKGFANMQQRLSIQFVNKTTETWPAHKRKTTLVHASRLCFIISRLLTEIAGFQLHLK